MTLARTKLREAQDQLLSSGITITHAVVTGDVVALDVVFYGPGRQIATSGVAKRDPSDPADLDVGINLALARALHSLAHRLERPAAGRIRHHDQVRELRRARAERPAPPEADPPPPAARTRTTRSRGLGAPPRQPRE